LIAKIKSQRPRNIRLCSVVVGELFFGAHRSVDPESNLKLVREFSDTFISLAFDDQAAECYGQLRATLVAIGSPIGPYDQQIASIALVRGLTVVTHNVSEFSRVPMLAIEDWR
jgi:tRNA(fMet)-specific endonuclease VapC